MAVNSDHIWNGSLVIPLAAIGGLWVLYQLHNLGSFAYLHFLRRSSLGRYMQSDSQGSAWALVTSASDGIGRGFAEELCHRGFNVVIHGQNEKKLEQVRDPLLEQWPTRELRLLIIDATDAHSTGAKLEAAVTPWKMSISRS